MRPSLSRHGIAGLITALVLACSGNSNPASPSNGVTLTASPNPAWVGDNVTLTWLGNTQGCSIPGTPAQNLPGNTSVSVPAIQETTTYTVTCQSGTASVTVVVQPAPTSDSLSLLGNCKDDFGKEIPPNSTVNHGTALHCTVGYTSSAQADIDMMILDDNGEILLGNGRWATVYPGIGQTSVYMSFNDPNVTHTSRLYFSSMRRNVSGYLAQIKPDYPLSWK